MKPLIEAIVQALVDKPEEVQIKEVIGDHAHVLELRVAKEDLGKVIGKGGAVIRAITEETGATVDIENDGTVRIASVDGASGKEARRRIELITADVGVEVGH